MHTVKFNHLPFECTENDTLKHQTQCWAHSVVTLGAETLSSVFSFYHVKLFPLYRIAEVAFPRAQVTRSLCCLTVVHHCALPKRQCLAQPKS